MKYITNIDTISALLDRLITENIKLYFFNKDNPSSIFIIKKKVKKVNSYDYVDPFTKEKLLKIKKNYYNKKTKQVFLEFNDINLFDNENKKLIVY